LSARAGAALLVTSYLPASENISVELTWPEMVDYLYMHYSIS